MKILVYGVHDGERDAIDNWQRRNQYELSCLAELFSLENVDLVKGFDGLCIQQSLPVQDEEIFRKLKDYGIKQIALRTAGFDMINLDNAKKYGITITYVPAYSPNAIAEMALTQTMNLVRKMNITQAKVKKNNFTWVGSLAPEIRSLTIGIVGVGRIGGVFAKLVSGLGAKVIGYDIEVREHENPVVAYQDSLEMLLQKADVVSIHLPHDKSTEYLINKHTLSLMKPSAYLINTARGMIVKSTDLIEALENNIIAGAALDTIDVELGYFTKNYSNQEIENEIFKKLLELPNVIITPHISFYTKTALTNMVDIALDSVVDILETGTSKNIVKK